MGWIMRFDWESLSGRGVVVPLEEGAGGSCCCLLMLEGVELRGGGDARVPLDVVLARRFEEVIVERLREGGSGGRDLSLSNPNFRPTLWVTAAAAAAKSEE